MKNSEQNRPSNARLAQRPLAVGLLGLFLFLFALTQIASLHRAVHPDADSPDHHCAVTLLSSGQLETPACVVAVVVPTLAADLPLVVVETFFVPSVDFSLPPSCGPPALLA